MSPKTKEHLEVLEGVLSDPTSSEKFTNWIAYEVGQYCEDGVFPCLEVDDARGAKVQLIPVLRLLSFVRSLGERSVHEIRHLLKYSMMNLGPFRLSPERWYQDYGTNPKNVGRVGELMASALMRRSEVLSDVNGWLKRLGIDYEIALSQLDDTSEMYSIKLKDTRNPSLDFDVRLTDVGYGISQILPLIVQGIMGENQIITIEQPEVHIHPRLQADIGDFLAYCIGRSGEKKQRPGRDSERASSPLNDRKIRSFFSVDVEKGNQFIIETHSEHLILRLLKLIRKGILSPDDVSVIYVSRGENGSTCEHLRIDEDGDFIDDWPEGFFTERFGELEDD